MGEAVAESVLSGACMLIIHVATSREPHKPYWTFTAPVAPRVGEQIQAPAGAGSTTWPVRELRWLMEDPKSPNSNPVVFVITGP